MSVSEMLEVSPVRGIDQMSGNAELTETQRREVRCKLHNDVESFLLQGGQVQKIDDNVRADPPRKPTINYGSSPI